MAKLKFAAGDSVVINPKGLSRMRGRKGIVVQAGPIKGEYAVEFADGHEPSLVYVEAVTLDRVRTDEAAGVGAKGPEPFG